MDVPSVLRVARQTTGLSQRALARLAGIGQSSLAEAESGAAPLRSDVLDRVLEACGLDLELVARGAAQLAADELGRLEEHLRLSLTQRLYVTLGGTEHWSTGPYPEQYLALPDRSGQLLCDTAARGVWIPEQRWSGRLDDLTAPVDTDEHLVPVPLTTWQRVLVRTPLALALRTPDGDERRGLVAAAAVLAMRPARDEGARRSPPHRSPDESLETGHLLRSLTYAMHLARELPDGRDGRGWRLDQPVSLRQLLRRDGLPPREGSQRHVG